MGFPCSLKLTAVELPHIRLFIVLTIATAARMNALLDLTWDRVDIERGLIYLHEPAKLRTSKGRAIVPMSEISQYLGHNSTEATERGYAR